MSRVTVRRTAISFVILALSATACTSSAAPETAPTVPPTTAVLATSGPLATPATTLPSVSSPVLPPSGSATLAPVTPAPVTPAPVTPVPVTPAPPSASPAPPTVPPTPTGPTPAPTVVVPTFSFTPDTNLESLFPKQIDGNKVKVRSFHATDVRGILATTPAQKKAFQDMLDSVGATIDDVTVAVGAVNLGGSGYHITAVRVMGADPNKLAQAFVTFGLALKDNPGDWVATYATVGGKVVGTLTDSKDSTASVDYGYPYGEVIFTTSTADPQIAAKLIGALP